MRLAILAGAFYATGCERIGLSSSDRVQIGAFDVVVRVSSDPGKPLSGAKIVFEDDVVGATDDAGLAKLTLTGSEGDIVTLGIRCPEGHDAAPSTQVTLRRLAEGSRAPRYDARCPPNLRTVVVGVRTEGAPPLPVVYLGRPMARTDASGAALFSLKVRAGEQVELTLATEEHGAFALRPQNPVLTFVSKPSDDFVVLEQRFQTERKVEARAASKPAPSKPTPL